MFQALQQAVVSATVGKFVLLANHVIAAEPAATQRLRAHAGRCVVVATTGWPSMLPSWPVLALSITPAGLLEWGGPGEPPMADLRITVDLRRPAGLLAAGAGGRRPSVEVAGDPALAADVSWLMDNLRWDVEDDLARLVGAGPAHEMARVGGLVAKGLRDTVKAFVSLGEKWRPGRRPDATDEAAPPR